MDKKTIKNIIPAINIGYEIPNIKRLVNIIASVYNIEENVYIMPMVISLDNDAYAYNAGGQYVIYLHKKHLERDRVTAHLMRVLLHEMWHVKQYADGRLNVTNSSRTVVWEGVEYGSQTEYGVRPWEIEAKAMEHKYYKQIKAKIADERG